ncbi:hypothetical protein [Kineococcus gypseus]|uniref:hypothetical protein n=1 Tax=Kineococcus gypseus TaxID=1637102 RepID=UPI003D7C82DF
MSAARARRAAVLLLSAALLTVPSACTRATSAVAPPAAPSPPAAQAGTGAAAAAPAAQPPAAQPPTEEAGAVGEPAAEDAAVAVLHDYLRQQALAVNARQSDPAALPAFTATLTPAARAWALPLLAANIGDEMPGPYPVGVLGSTRTPDRVELALCLQDRGWQVDRATGRPLNPPHRSRATAVVVREGGRWLVDDLTAAAEECPADQVREERF